MRQLYFKLKKLKNNLKNYFKTIALNYHNGHKSKYS